MRAWGRWHRMVTLIPFSPWVSGGMVSPKKGGDMRIGLRLFNVAMAFVSDPWVFVLGMGAALIAGVFHGGK
jgi:hypothetical protein